MHACSHVGIKLHDAVYTCTKGATRQYMWGEGMQVQGFAQSLQPNLKTEDPPFRFGKSIYIIIEQQTACMVGIIALLVR